MFVIKKILERLLWPSTFIILLWLLAAVLYYLKKSRAAKIIAGTGIALLVIISLPWTANWLMNPLQDQYGPLKQAPSNTQYIVVLGGGYMPILHLPSNDNLNHASAARLIEGIRLWRQIPHSRLIFSGADYYGHFNDGDVMAKTAKLLGVPGKSIITQNKALDTASQAKVIKHITKGAPFILVTAAYHMPRAMKLFEKQGLHPVAAPCDYQFFGGNTLFSAFPSSKNSVGVTIAWHEYLGLLALSITG